MRSLFLLAILGSLATAQPRTVTGRVTDEAGQPIAEAHIDYTGDDAKQFQTDAQGRFILETKPPAIVIRKYGYRSEFVRLADQRELQVVLHAETPRPFPICPGSPAPNGIEPWRYTLHTPASTEVERIKTDNGDDTYTEYYRWKQQKKSAQVEYGTGPLWGLGLPWSIDIWNSIRYSETTFDFAKIPEIPVTDARGEDASGKHWRIIGRFGESIQYRDADAETAAVLDKFLDGVCLAYTHP